MTSKYKGVSKKRSCSSNSKDWIMAITINGERLYKRFARERDAAIAYDIKLLENGRDPINILTKKVA